MSLAWPTALSRWVITPQLLRASLVTRNCVIRGIAVSIFWWLYHKQRRSPWKTNSYQCMVVLSSLLPQIEKWWLSTRKCIVERTFEESGPLSPYTQAGKCTRTAWVLFNRKVIAFWLLGDTKSNDMLYSYHCFQTDDSVTSPLLPSLGPFRLIGLEPTVPDVRKLSQRADIFHLLNVFDLRAWQLDCNASTALLHTPNLPACRKACCISLYLGKNCKKLSDNQDV